MKLDLSSHNLTTLSDSHLQPNAYHSTTILSLASNLFSALPVSQKLLHFVNLRKLDLSYNQLQRVNLRELPLTLRWLSLKGNQLSEIYFRFRDEDGIALENNSATHLVQNAPQLHSMKTFSNLEYLDLSNNGLSEIPENFASIFVSLKHLFVSDNFIKALPEKLPPALVHLDLRENRIRSFDRIRPIKHLKRLKFLRLKGNPIEHIPSYEFICSNIVSGLRLLDDNLVRPDEMVSEEDAYIEQFDDEMDELEDEFDNDIESAPALGVEGGTMNGTVLTGPSRSGLSRSNLGASSSSLRQNSSSWLQQPSSNLLQSKRNRFRPHTGPLQPLSPPESPPSSRAHSPPGTPIVDVESDTASSTTNMTPPVTPSSHRKSGNGSSRKKRSSRYSEGRSSRIDSRENHEERFSMQPKEIEPDAQDPHIDYELIIQEKQVRMSNLSIELSEEGNDGRQRAFSPLRPSPLTRAQQLGNLAKTSPSSRRTTSPHSNMASGHRSQMTTGEQQSQLNTDNILSTTKHPSPAQQKVRDLIFQDDSTEGTATSHKSESTLSQHDRSVSKLVEENTNLKMELAYIRELLETSTKEQKQTKQRMRKLMNSQKQQPNTSSSKSTLLSSDSDNTLQDRHNALLTKYSTTVEKLAKEKKKTAQLKADKQLLAQKVSEMHSTFTQKIEEYEQTMKLLSQYMKDQDEDIHTIMSGLKNSQIKLSTKKPTSPEKSRPRSPSTSNGKKTSSSTTLEVPQSNKRRTVTTPRRLHRAYSTSKLDPELLNNVSNIITESNRLRKEYQPENILTQFRLTSKSRAQKMADKRKKQLANSNLLQHENIPFFDYYSDLRQERFETGRYANSHANFAKILRSPPSTLAQDKDRRQRMRKSWRQSQLKDFGEDYDYQKQLDRSFNELEGEGEEEDFTAFHEKRTGSAEGEVAAEDNVKTTKE